MKNETVNKYYPKVGEKLYLHQVTGNCMVDMVKHPYTVIGVTNSKVLIQECELIFNGPRYYDTLPDDIREDETGEILQLNWSPKRGKWINSSYPGDTYPRIAEFGAWLFQPYLD